MQDNKDKIREKNIDNISKHIADTKIKNKIKKIDKIKRGLIIKKYSKDFFYIIVGCFIMAMGTSLFLLPNQLSSGGFAGISTIIYYLFKLPLGITMFFLNIPLLILAFFKISKELFLFAANGINNDTLVPTPSQQFNFAIQIIDYDELEAVADDLKKIISTILDD